MTRQIIRGGTGVISCGHPLAASAGVFAFERGGTAADAAVAAALVLAVVLPHQCGLGGDAMVLCTSSDGSSLALNGSGKSPMLLTVPLPEEGPGLAAVPGAVDAWVRLLEIRGKLSLEEVSRPAVVLAERGFPVDQDFIRAREANRVRLVKGSPGWSLLESSQVAGTIVRQGSLVQTLRRLGLEGGDGLYRGEVAAAIARTCRVSGGQMTSSDLADHETMRLAPIESRYRGCGLRVQPPTSQAILALMMLKAIESSRPAERLHMSIEAVEAAFEFRDQIAVAGSAESLLNHELDIDRQRAQRRGGPRGLSHTAAVATADADGTVVSLLTSVFDAFGCGFIVEPGGFLLNDRLCGFSRDPDSPNAPRPGARPVHTLSPAILENDDYLCGLATPGADGQVQTLMQVVDAIVTDGLTFSDAIDRPRWRSQDSRVFVELGFDQKASLELEKRGHHISVLPDGHDLFGSVACAGVDRRTGSLFAFSDWRRESWAAAL
jgi:gamma-glutamyltranspeptidase / glutathione hydrolase